MLLCGTCKSIKHKNCQALEFKRPKALVKLVNYILALVSKISYDSERLQIDKEVEGFREENEKFLNDAQDLEEKAKKCITKAENYPKYISKFAVLYKQAENLQDQISDSLMYKSYKDFIVERRLQKMIFDSKERFINVMDRNLAPKLKEGLAEIQVKVEQQKMKEIKEFKMQFKQKMKDKISDFNLECAGKVQEVLNLIQKQQKISELAGEEHLNKNKENQQALKDLIQSYDDQSIDNSKTFESVRTWTEALIDHISAYRRVKKDIKKDYKTVQQELNKVSEKSDAYNEKISKLNKKLEKLNKTKNQMKQELDESHRKIA